MEPWLYRVVISFKGTENIDAYSWYGNSTYFGYGFQNHLLQIIWALQFITLIHLLSSLRDQVVGSLNRQITTFLSHFVCYSSSWTHQNTTPSIKKIKRKVPRRRLGLFLACFLQPGFSLWQPLVQRVGPYVHKRAALHLCIQTSCLSCGSAATQVFSKP